MKNQRKVFCIGFQKTGTTSLGKALGMLGYKVCGPVGTLDPDIQDKALEIALKYTDRYDAFEDHPWPLLYRELDRIYPGSKFILTVRRPKSWLKSVLNYFGGYDSAPDRRWVYGAGNPVGNERLYLRRFKEHNKNAKAYFKDRPDDFLVLDLAKDNGWEELCAFLGHEVPNKPFPHLNKKGSLLSIALSNIPGIAGIFVDFYDWGRKRMRSFTSY